MLLEILKIKFRLNGLTLGRGDLDLCRTGRKLRSAEFQEHPGASKASTPAVNGPPAHLVWLDGVLLHNAELELAPEVLGPPDALALAVGRMRDEAWIGRREINEHSQHDPVGLRSVVLLRLLRAVAY